MLSKLPSPSIIAHRGASAYAPENTLAAFKLALQQGADGIELDAQLTADEQVIVFHDPTVDRITPCKGRINDLTLAELRKMDAGSHFDIAFRGESIPTLEDVFKSVGQLTYINIELKAFDSLTDSLPKKVAQLVKRYHLTQRVLISSFNPIPIICIRRMLPKTPIGLLALRGNAGLLARSWPGRFIRYQSLHVELNDATPDLVNDVHKRGYKIFVYTANTEEEIGKLYTMGVDGFFTNDPLRARQVLDGDKSQNRDE
jgi:glycerophosphoryl diester phosphodiesterase